MSPEWYILHLFTHFYRAMHFGAKRGIAIACRLSVCPSVCLSVTLQDCDHIGWNSSKIISPLVSLGWSLFATPTWRVCSKGNTLNLGTEWPTPVDLSVGDIWSQIAAEWLQIAQRSQWEPIGNHHRSFEWCHRWPLRPPLPPKTGVPYAPTVPPYANGHISATGDPIRRSTSCLVLE